MEIEHTTSVSRLLRTVPECEEYLSRFLPFLPKRAKLADLYRNTDALPGPVMSGLRQCVKRAKNDPCHFSTMRRQVVAPDAVNIAGFAGFLWEQPLIDELTAKANELGIRVNINIFQKHRKKQFQNYLARCQSPGDLPDVLIGKGFSSLTSSRFVDMFVKKDCFYSPEAQAPMGDLYRQNDFSDPDCAYHPFGVEELVMLRDEASNPQLKDPLFWSDILTRRYGGMLSQTSKSEMDHFGFILMLYLYVEHGEDGIRLFADNVRAKQHFAYTIRYLGMRNPLYSSPIHIMHHFATLFIRSDVRAKTHVIKLLDGNPAMCNFFLLKKTSGREACQLAMHLYSDKVKQLLENCGTAHITSNYSCSGNEHVRWIGWDRIKQLNLPYLKDYLGLIAYTNFKHATDMEGIIDQHNSTKTN